ncbi:MAG TPA: chemotaxis protein CheB [Usitatibacter sp.]|nr:chemotaxis protein CheB [Usitatibacter sp.]
MASERIVVVGGSAGGVRALQTLASTLPADFPAPILVVQHIGSHPSILPQLLARSGPLPAAHARDGERISPGRIHVAPPDYHMLVDGDFIRLSHGPKEQYTRPAIDPLFRSTAVAWAQRTIGVLLSGLLDDGTEGLQGIKRSGGIAVVQDPADAEMPSMPLSALEYVDVDYRRPMSSMGALLVSLVARPAPASAKVAPIREIVAENDILLGKGDFMENLRSIASPSTFACPECHGALWEVDHAKPRRFRCHTGHGYTLRTLQHAQSTSADEALWSALRALQEKQLLLETLAESHARAGDADEARRLAEEAALAREHGETLRRLVESVPPPPQ